MHKLASIAREEACRCFHGCVSGTESNLDPIIAPFPKWTKAEADGNWCAAFVYYCCGKAGYGVPIRPAEGLSCNLAGCGAWEEWAMTDEQLAYHRPSNADNFEPAAGDIVLFDRVFNGSEHDHIGIVLDAKQDRIVTAEGNINNISGILERPRDEHIRAYIRIPENFIFSYPV